MTPLLFTPGATFKQLRVKVKLSSKILLLKLLIPFSLHEPYLLSAEPTTP